MRVLVDAHMLGHRETGNETYVYGLLSGLATRGDVDVAAVVDPAFQPVASAPSSTTWLRLRSSGNGQRLLGDLARLASDWKADVIHSTYFAPFRAPCPVVISVHDVSFQRFPEYFSWRDRALFATLLPSSLRRAAAILTLSNHTRDEIRHFFPALRTPVHVVPGAAGERFQPLDDATIAARLARHNLRRPFFLAVGTLQPRKNLARLIEAYASVRQAHPHVDLVIVGPRGFQSSWMPDAIRTRGVADSVRVLDYVPDDELVALYNSALALVYPSVYEGFGLPVIEAMACGRPVIAADRSSLPEVAGDAALLIDPIDVSALRNAMTRLVDDPHLAHELAGRGLERAAHFTWRRTADAAVTAYRSVG